MINEFGLDAEDKEIIDELDNFCGVVDNKLVLENMVKFAKLKNKGDLTFGNYNIVLRLESEYDLLNDFLTVCAKLFRKNNIIQNDGICYLTNNDKSDFLSKIFFIEEGIIVLDEQKIGYNFFEREKDNIKKYIDKKRDKVFIFLDRNYRDGDTDAEIDDLASWRMTINKISLEDKSVYCFNMLDSNDLKYKRTDVKEFADQPFWLLKKGLMQLIVECKGNETSLVTKEVLKKYKGKSNNKERTRRNIKKEKNEKTSKQELEELIGLTDIKDEMQKILNYIKLNKERGKMPTLHMCFNGNPGTGKTSIARIIGKLFQEEKILSNNGEYVEIHGRDLVDKYVGWTAVKVHEIIEKAMGGVLFIDEAYSLNANVRGSFEDEAIATLIKEMEDHRNDLCIILAGYTNEMNELIKRNPGFESRIQFTINFKDYTAEELYKIFEGLCKNEKYKLSPNCKQILLDNFEKARRQEDFGNGRYVRNIFEKIKFEQADRVVKTNSKSIDTIIAVDVMAVLDNFKINTPKKRVIGF